MSALLREHAMHPCDGGIVKAERASEHLDYALSLAFGSVSHGFLDDVIRADSVSPSRAVASGFTTGHESGQRSKVAHVSSSGAEATT